jgi:murein DD-endopeptidase MepM/ murein hydrolase activator NlpD
MDFTKLSPQLFGPFKTEGGGHKRPQDVEFWMGWKPDEQKQTWKGVQPSTFKMLDPNKDAYQLALQKMPNTLIVLRSWHLDDNNGDRWNELMANPTAAGEAIIDGWIAMADTMGIDYSRTVFMLWNEPHEWEGDAAKRNLTTATLAAMRRRKQVRPQMALLLINLGVGWPGNHDTATVKDTPPDWSPYEPVRQEMLIDKIDVVGLHEYWMKGGPAVGFKWYAGRFLQCPWQVPIVIGEAAYSGAVGKPQGSVPTALQGWAVSGLTAEQYMAQMIAYNDICRSDPRIIGWEVYLCDYANREWQAKDIEPMYGLLRTNLAKFQPRAQTFKWSTSPLQPPVTPPVTPPPMVVTPTAQVPILTWPVDAGHITQQYGENPANYAKFGLRGHNGIDIGVVVGTPVKAVADGVVAFTDTDPGGYGLYLRIWHKALRCYSFYGHLSAVKCKVGDAVKQGQIVALSGNTGNSTGPHLHYELRLANEAGVYQVVDRMGKGAVDPVSFAAGLERGAALAPGYRVFMPVVAGQGGNT